jgi:uncharacterized protein (TIGR01777 family)
MLCLPIGLVVLAGGSGFLGQALAKELLARDFEVVILTRSPASKLGRALQVAWDGKDLGDWADSLEGARAVINLAGKSVNCRYNPVNRREIIDSRVDSLNVLGKAILNCVRPPDTFVQAASLAIYGDAGEQICYEDSHAGKGFSPEVCLTWESTFDKLKLPATRKALLRIGFALGQNGGALETLARLTRFYLGGSVGAGRQYISWIHQHDLNQMFLWCIDRPDIEGVFNATGPNPVRNATFMRKLRQALHRPWSPPTPSWAVRWGAWLMGTEAELALTGRRCMPGRFLEKDFQFAYPELDNALESLFSRTRQC